MVRLIVKSLLRPLTPLIKVSQRDGASEYVLNRLESFTDEKGWHYAQSSQQTRDKAQFFLDQFNENKFKGAQKSITGYVIHTTNYNNTKALDVEFRYWDNSRTGKKR